NCSAVAFNFAAPGYGPIMQWLYLRRLVRDGCRPDVVIAEYFPSSMTDQNWGTLGLGSVGPENVTSDEASFLAAYGFNKSEFRAVERRTWLCPLGVLRQSIVAHTEPRLIPTTNALRAAMRMDHWGGFLLTKDMFPIGARDLRTECGIRAST